jgi:hypothetical protein
MLAMCFPPLAEKNVFISRMQKLQFFFGFTFHRVLATRCAAIPRTDLLLDYEDRQ